MTDNQIKGGKIRRFSSGRIIEHAVHMVVFGILVATGLSQKFYTLDMSQWLIHRMGGIDMVRMLHRFTGLVFAGLTFLHLYVGITGILFRKWQPSIAVSKNDFTDAIHNIKYYLGMKNHPALCGHYNYVQKFEYWNVLIAGFLMIASGLVLIFPLFATRFLPGEIIPAAKLLHSNEALLVLLIIAIWHIYNAIFSPEVFPLNSSIFTGYISRQRMVREHPLELAKIEGKPVEEIILHEYDEAPEPLVQN